MPNVSRMVFTTILSLPQDELIYFYFLVHIYLVPFVVYFVVTPGFPSKKTLEIIYLNK
jgi:hypothetical protein